MLHHASKWRVLALVAVVLLAGLPAAGHTQTPAAGEAAGDGPAVIVGKAGSASAEVTEALFPEPSVVLIDVARRIQGDYGFVPDEGQILGVMTTPLFPMPGEYRIDLPIQPHASSIDLDNNGEDDAGVQIFALLISSNLTGDSYLRQLEQFGGLGSYLTDIQTGAVIQGDFLVYAPDAEQAFPSGVGADGQWFTGDDEVTPLDAGYTVVRLAADGTSTRDRGAEVTIDTMEAPAAASPDFSDQGIVESYNSLIDLLAVRYAYTEFAGIDWDAMRATYLPAVEAAEASQDYAAYYYTLVQLAMALEDPHVSASTYNLDIVVVPNPALVARTGNLGVTVVAVTDPEHPDQAPGDTVVVVTVGADTPAEQAGWVPGTEIISINDTSVAERFDELPLLLPAGTAETQRAIKVPFFLTFAPGEEVTVEYRLPDDDEVRTVTLEAGEYDTGSVYLPSSPLPISLTSDGQYTVLTWSNFISAIDTKVAVLEEAVSNPGTGLILDLRGNTGGWEELYEVMASYFFTADAPMRLPLFDGYHFDPDEQAFVKEFQTDVAISAPDPMRAYEGPLVILVDEHCVSACEYFTQTLQTLGRAKVVGQYGTLGGGGPIDAVRMPADIVFQYTVGRTTFAGTDEYNIQGRGVTPDIRVPVTLETELAKNQGEDPVMDAARAEIDRQAQEMAAEQEPDLVASPGASPAAAGD